MCVRYTAPRFQTRGAANGRVGRPAHTATGSPKAPHHRRPLKAHGGHTNEKIAAGGGSFAGVVRASKPSRFFFGDESRLPQSDPFCNGTARPGEYWPSAPTPWKVIRAVVPQRLKFRPDSFRNVISSQAYTGGIRPFVAGLTLTRPDPCPIRPAL